MSYEVLVTSAVSTRVVDVMFQIPDSLEFLSWEDGDFISAPLRIGPTPHEATRRLLVALATTSKSPITASSGTVGTATFLRTGVGGGEVSLLEACLVDGSYREDWVVTPENPVHPAPPLGHGAPVPAGFAMPSASPNPMVRSTTVSFEIPRPGCHVKIKIYDVRGREVRTLVDQPKAPGYHSEVWDLTNNDGRRVSSGIYFCGWKRPTSGTRRRWSC